MKRPVVSSSSQGSRGVLVTRCSRGWVVALLGLALAGIVQAEPATGVLGPLFAAPPVASSARAVRMPADAQRSSVDGSSLPAAPTATGVVPSGLTSAGEPAVAVPVAAVQPAARSSRAVDVTGRPIAVAGSASAGTAAPVTSAATSVHP
jgi:hypothetical protein